MNESYFQFLAGCYLFIYFTCFILSRSNESVSLPLPPGRILHNNNKKKISIRFAAVFLLQRHMQLAVVVPALTLKPLTCLQSQLGPTASLHHLGDKRSTVRWNNQQGFTDISKEQDLRQTDGQTVRGNTCEYTHIHLYLNQGWFAFLTLLSVQKFVSRLIC